MEIIHIILGKANPQRMNGVNKVVYQLATQQALHGRNVCVWGFTKDMSINFGVRPFNTRLFKTTDDAFYLDPSFAQAIASYDRENVIFHFHGGWIPLFSTIQKVLHNQGFKFVITAHGAYNTVAMQKSKWMKKIYFWLYERALLKRAKAIHCIGQSEYDGLHRLYNNEKMVVLPYGMIMPSGPQSTKMLDKDNFVFGFIGRLDYHTKGLDLMVEAFATYFKNKTGVYLWIIGDGPGLSALRQKITALGVQSNVILFGSKFNEDKINLLKQMNVFLHPSRNEGMPSAVLEATAYGVPVIVSKATNIGDYIANANAGLVIENEDVNALAISMLYMYNAHEDVINQMGHNAMSMVRENFNWNTIVDQFDKLYN
jgi:glycosyltransferase involved in cell wall biosynthesis